VEAIFGYPVKSMAGGTTEVVTLGWNGDSGLAFWWMDDRSAFP